MADIRYYPQMVFLGALALWLYLRLLESRRQAKAIEYAALTAVCLAALVTHLMSIALFAAVGAYHLLVARKDRRWLLVCAAAVVALALAAPTILKQLPAGMEQYTEQWGNRSAGRVEVLSAYAMVMSNGNPVLLLLSAVGLVVGWRRQQTGRNPFPLLLCLFVAAIMLVSDMGKLLTVGSMRYFLVGIPIVMAFVATGLYSLYRLERSLVLLVLLWIAGGLFFARNGDWTTYLAGNHRKFRDAPWTEVSRQMRESASKQPALIINLPWGGSLISGRIPGYNMKVHWFSRHGLEVFRCDEAASAACLADRAADTPAFWTIHKPTSISDATWADISASISGLSYEPCETVELSLNTVMIDWRWKELACKPLAEIGIPEPSNTE